MQVKCIRMYICRLNLKFFKYFQTITNNEYKLGSELLAQLYYIINNTIDNIFHTIYML